MIIAHRLSTIRYADRIIVLHKGQVVEQGTHHSLMRARGAYYTLVERQNAHQDEGKSSSIDEDHQSADNERKNSNVRMRHSSILNSMTTSFWATLSGRRSSVTIPNMEKSIEAEEVIANSKIARSSENRASRRVNPTRRGKF